MSSGERETVFSHPHFDEQKFLQKHGVRIFGSTSTEDFPERWRRLRLVLNAVNELFGNGREIPEPELDELREKTEGDVTALEEDLAVFDAFCGEGRVNVSYLDGEDKKVIVLGEDKYSP